MKLAIAVAAMLAFSPSAYAQTDLARDFSGALKGCEAWVLDPSSWISGPAPFIKSTGLGPGIAEVASVDDAALPPPEMRLGNHYWRIASSDHSGFILVVSDRLPFCHITGGGDTDLQPAIEAVVNSKAFSDDWRKTGEQTEGDMISGFYNSRRNPGFSIVISRANHAGARLDRVQIIATAVYKLQ